MILKGSYKGDECHITKSKTNLIIQINTDRTGSIFKLPLCKLREILT